MLYIFLTLSTIALLFIVICYWITLGKKVKRLRLLVCGIVAFVIATCCTFGICEIPNATYEEKIPTDKLELVEADGKIFDYNIKRMNIEEEDVYVYFYQTDNHKTKTRNGHYPLFDIGYAKVQDTEVIVNEDIDEAYIIKYTVYTKNVVSDLWRTILLFNNEEYISKKNTYEIYTSEYSRQLYSTDIQVIQKLNANNLK